jgi:hypothetical protein
MHPMSQNGHFHHFSGPFRGAPYMVQAVRQTNLKIGAQDLRDDWQNCKLFGMANYSYRRISTGRIREAARAGISVAIAQIRRAAAAIQKASNAFG